MEPTMYTYYLNERDEVIPAQGFGNSLEEVYPGIATVVEVNETDDGWNAVQMKNRGPLVGWVPVAYRTVDNNDLDEIVGAFSV